MKKYIAVPIALGISAGLLADEVLGEGSPHAEFIAVSPTPMSNIAFGNGTATVVVMSSVVPENFTPVEWKIPHDRLVAQTTGLGSPPKK